MAARDLVVIGASAGGVEALMTMVARLPPELPASLFVVVHVPASAESMLPAILARAGSLPADRAVHGGRYVPGRIYVAPPDHHLLLLGDRIRLSRGPRVNGHRPAIDPLFRSAARQFGPRVIGVVLSGALDDGAAGMVAIKRSGGGTIVQAPSDALYPDMPTSVLEHVAVDHSVPADRIADVLARMVDEPVASGGSHSITERAADMPTDELELEEHDDEEIGGSPSMFTCPECNGALWELDDGDELRYRCHVGHAWAPDSLLAGQSEALEEAVWDAYRALRENAMLAQRLAMCAEKQGLQAVARQYRARHDEALARANLLRGVLERGQLSARKIADDSRDT